MLREATSLNGRHRRPEPAAQECGGAQSSARQEQAGCVEDSGTDKFPRSTPGGFSRGPREAMHLGRVSAARNCPRPVCGYGHGGPRGRETQPQRDPDRIESGVRGNAERQKCNQERSGRRSCGEKTSGQEERRLAFLSCYSHSSRCRPGVGSLDFPRSGFAAAMASSSGWSCTAGALLMRRGGG